MTTGSSWGGGGGKKSLWASDGKKKKDGFGWGSGGGGGKKPGKSYQGKNWAEWDEPPRSGGSIKYSDGDKDHTATAKSSDWDFRSPSEEWRKWRPEVNESQSPDWQWNRDGRESQLGRDVPVTHIEKTIRSKD